jgi:hypothetical protein
MILSQADYAAPDPNDPNLSPASRVFAVERAKRMALKKQLNSLPAGSNVHFGDVHHHHHYGAPLSMPSQSHNHNGMYMQGGNIGQQFGQVGLSFDSSPGRSFGQSFGQSFSQPFGQHGRIQELDSRHGLQQYGRSFV